MQALVHDTYGPLEMLEPRTIAVPPIGDRDVLVRVQAAAVHIGDVFAVEGRPFPVRLTSGLRRPRYGVPGLDVAGTVEAVGSAVTRLRVGDRVVGSGSGTAAELARASEDQLVAVPDGLTMAQAAALPTSGLAALHGLRDAARLRAGQRVLINGASGGVGTFEVQIAKSMGAHVTGVASTRNLELLRSLGADEVIDYTQEDFTKRTGAFDVIVDNIENRPAAAIRRALTPTGTLVLNSGTGATGVRMLVRLVAPIVAAWFSKQTVRRYLSTPNHADLTVLANLVASGAVRPVIDRTYPLHEAAAALQHVRDGHARGKVVVTV